LTLAATVALTLVSRQFGATLPGLAFCVLSLAVGALATVVDQVLEPVQVSVWIYERR